MRALFHAIMYERSFQIWLTRSHVSASNMTLARRWYALNRLYWRD